MPLPDHTEDYYLSLGVSWDASEADIKRAYRAKARECHPDFGGSPQSMTLVNEAYEVLSDPERRRVYNDACGLAGESKVFAATGAESPTVDEGHRSDIQRFYGGLLLRAVFSVFLGLLCLAATGDTHLISRPFYWWALTCLGVAALAFGVFLGYSAHLASQSGQSARREQSRWGSYKLLFWVLVAAFIDLVLVLPGG